MLPACSPREACGQGWITTLVVRAALSDRTAYGRDAIHHLGDGCDSDTGPRGFFPW
jgi:hypothetical protein